MKVTYNITQNKFNANLNQETTEIKVKFQTGYYPLPGGGDLSNYYTKDETYSKTEVDDIIADIPGGDTSNLVPYTGANKDVNIGSYYFESSQGFKKTNGTANQALTANGDTFDLNTKADKAFNIKVTTPSSYVTGTTSETQVLRIEIPANSLSESDLLKIPYLHISKIGSALVQTRIKLSTSPTMPSGITDQIAQYLNPPATMKSVGMMRTYKIYNGQIWGYSFTDNGISDITTNVNNGLSSKPFNRSETNYLYVSLKLGDSTDQARLEGIQLTNS